jgi:phage terminase small subunit
LRSRSAASLATPTTPAGRLIAILENYRHQRFAQELAKGKSATEAYSTAGYKPSRHHACHLQHKRHISQRVAELLEKRDKMDVLATQKATKELAIDKKWIMSRLKENAERALQKVAAKDADGNVVGEYRYDGNVANRALELLGKELGMFIDRREIGAPGSFEDMDVREREHLLHVIDAELARRKGSPASGQSSRPH